MKQQKIALIMDWDDTLCPDSISGLVAQMGVQPEDFWQPLDELVQQGWDIVTAYMFGLKNIFANQPGVRKAIRQFAQSHVPFKGTEDLLDRCHALLRENGYEQVTIDASILSSGLKPIIEAHSLSKQFDHIWGSDFYELDGQIHFPKVVLNFSDKIRCITQIHKGLSDQISLDVTQFVSKKDRPIPYDRMIYVGDGYTDIPCFARLTAKGGQCIAVVPESRSNGWALAENLKKDGRVAHIGPANYSPESPTWETLCDSLLRAASLATKR